MQHCINIYCKTS